MSSRNPGPLLVIEDGDEDFDMLQLTFRRSGVTNPLFRCVDGDEALDFLRGQGPFAEHPESAPPPSLIVLDLNLPGTDGREVLQALRGDPRTKHIPVMVLSTSNNPRDIELCYRMGANAYAIKPIGLEKLEHLVELMRQFWLEAMELPTVQGGSA
jgi:CheY-like chemotaxis protein